MSARDELREYADRYGYTAHVNALTAADIARVDVTAEQLAAEMRALKAKAAREEAALKLPDLSPERFQWLADHRQPAPIGERLEYRHWLHDADPDSTVPAFHVDLTKHQAGGQS